MPEVTVTIGGRSYEVACQEGEEHFLTSAAEMLDVEAKVLSSQIGRLPEPRMLLMAGLMLADKTAGLEEQLRQSEARAAQFAAQLETLQNTPAPPPERVEVPVIPGNLIDTMAELAARAEALASNVEDRARN